ncbi:hypothetical protein OKW23_000060 [Bacilli bacterium PM5-9]|nr:hypothetical protein [Bacilli bacterium PM5-9]
MATERPQKKSTNSQTIIKNKRDAKSSLIGKVNSEDNKKTIPNEKTKTSLADKVNKSEASRPEVKKVETPKNNASSNVKKKVETNKKENKSKKKRQGKFYNSFFFKLSFIGRMMLVIMIVGVLILSVLGVNALMHKGKVVLGSRQEPVLVISNDDVSKVKSAVESAVSGADKISVDYAAYRLVIVADLNDSSTVNDGKDANKKIYNAVNSVLPISKYFDSKDKLNNDLYIYSSDTVPTNYETNSKYIYQTYKNSKMPKPYSYNLLKPRDKKSAKEVLETMEKAGK